MNNYEVFENLINKAYERNDIKELKAIKRKLVSPVNLRKNMSIEQISELEDLINYYLKELEEK